MTDYILIRSRRRSLAIQISPRGTVTVRAPLSASQASIDAFVASKETWIAKCMKKLPPTQPPLTAQERKKLIRQAKEDLPKRTAYWAQQLGVNFGRISIRTQRTRWGSCSRQGNLSFNCLLMLAPPEIRDYVVIHELCHRKEMNHSHRFWALVEAAAPDYVNRRKWLKEHGGALMARLAEE